MSNPNACNSFTRTLKLSGTPGSGIFSPLTIASYALTRPTVSSDFTVKLPSLQNVVHQIELYLQVVVVLLVSMVQLNEHVFYHQLDDVVLTCT